MYVHTTYYIWTDGRSDRPRWMVDEWTDKSGCMFGTYDMCPEEVHYDGPISECAHAHIALIYIHNSLTLYCCFLFFSCSRNCGCVGDYWRSETDRRPKTADRRCSVDVDVFVLFCFLNICGPETPRVFLYEEV